jgi:hypothetical protein
MKNALLLALVALTVPMMLLTLIALVLVRLKQRTYRILDGKFGETGSAATEAQKALARGLKSYRLWLG